MTNRMQNPSHHLKRQNFRFALVVEETDALRISVVQFLRKQGWLVHGIKRAEQALNLLPHIPYTIIAIDSELPGVSWVDFVGVLHKSSEWREIELFVITSSQSRDVAMQVTERGGFLIRKATWQDDLCEFLSAYDEDPDSLHKSHAWKSGERVAG